MKSAMRCVRTALLAVAILLLGLSACGEPLATPELAFLSARGSAAMVPLLFELAESYRANAPTVSIDVAGHGSRFGIEAIQSEEADMAFVSWLPADLADNRRATPIARDGLAVIVHPGNRVDGLGLLQLQDLFSGRAYDWSAIGPKASDHPVQPVVREPESGDLDAFLAKVMADQEVTPRAIVLPSAEAVLEYVSRNRGAIGFVPMNLPTDGVKVLAIEGERLTPQSTQDGSYPLARDLWIISADPPDADVQAFLDFVRGPAGQQIVGRHFGRIK